MRVRYTVEKRSLPRVDEPPTSKLLRVWTNGFGYIREDGKSGTAEKEFLETGGTIVCSVLYLRSARDGLCVIAHLSPHLGHFEAINQLLSYLLNHRLIKKLEFDDIQILKTLLSYKPALDETYIALKTWGLNARVARCLPTALPIPIAALSSNNVSLFDVSGNISLVNRDTLNITDLGIVAAVRRRHSVGKLFCENDGDFVKEEPFEIYPGVPSLDVKTGGRRNRYVLNLKAEKEVDPRVLADIAQNGVRVDFCRCANGEYVSISVRGFTYLTTDVVYGVRNTAYAIASAID